MANNIRHTFRDVAVLGIKHFLLLALIQVFLVAEISAKAIEQVTVSSPDKKLQMKLDCKGGSITYAVLIDGKTVIQQSRLGLEFQGFAWGNAATIADVNKKSNNSTWNNPMGKTSKVVDHYNEATIQFQEKSGSRFGIALRAYNDGIAFRYILPNRDNSTLMLLTKEQTEFAFAGDYPCYSGDLPKNVFNGKHAYEWEYLPGKLSALKGGQVLGIPLLVQTPAAWVAIAESDLLDWSGMWLSKPAEAESSAKVGVQLAPLLDGPGLVRITNQQHSPWRVLMVGRQPGRLMESDIIVNLSTPSKIGDASWVRPGMMAWDHWWTGDVKMNTATLKEYVQLAADMGWPYQLVDWQWYGKFNNPEADITKLNPEVNMDELRQFAKERNVKLWLWMHWADVERNNAYEKAFALYESWGIAGVKIDFMDRDDQYVVNWYEKIAKAAADHHLMLIFHGAYKPTGLERTYPNQVTREGILGNEYNRWSKLVTTEHKLTLPFTRFLTGPADFTPGGFLNRQPEQFKIDGKAAQVQGTRAQELALFVIYNSPITVACDHPAHYKSQPGIDFLKIVPTAWDETKVIEASVSDYIVEARRSGEKWFVGAMTDNSSRNISVPLKFLPKGKFKLTIWRDAADSNDDAEKMEKEERIVSSADTLSVSMVRNGGYVATLEPM